MEKVCVMWKLYMNAHIEIEFYITFDVKIADNREAPNRFRMTFDVKLVDKSEHRNPRGHS